MAKEYIEREALIKGFTSDGCRFVYGNSTVKAIVSRIVATPAADVVEVVHGKWVRHYYDSGEPIDDKWYCSECHMCNDHRRTWYCPNCGAKMDGERKDNGAAQA